MSSIKPTTVPSKRLSESITGASTTFKVNSITGWDGVALTSADFGTKLYAVFRNSAGTLMEIMSVDPTTITSASSAITILLRGLKFDGDLTTEVAGNKLSWVKGDTIVEFGTHVPQLIKSFVDIYGAQTIEGVKTFSSPPIVPTPVSPTDAANKDYTDTLIEGTLTTINIIVPGVDGETITAGKLIYFDDTTNYWKLCDADTATTVDNVMLGMAQGSGTVGVLISGGVLVRGLDSNQGALTAGVIYYAGNTAGAISSSAGTTEVSVGFSYSTTQLYFNPRFNQQITEDQQDALAGSLGTPNLSNPFVTQNEVRAVTAMAAQEINGTLGSIFTRTLATNETFTQSGFTTGRVFMVEVKQGSGTTYNPTWFAGITWVTIGSAAPTQTTTTNGITTFGFRCTGTNTFLGYLISTQ